MDEWIKKAANPTPAEASELMGEAVGDAMAEAMGEINPRIWCIIQEQIMTKPHDTVHANAVINAALSAVITWTMAMGSGGQTFGRDNDEILRQKIGHMVTACSETPLRLDKATAIASSVGKLKLMDDAMKGLSNTLVSNSMVIKGITELLKRRE